ncbi:MAG: carbonate dehydratase [Candidatus Omnitrophica bacterium]|nr:carbonate dehydratase [Candidatus Omnitrophota bacterium]
MRTLKHIFENNKRWAETIKKDDPDFFNKLASQQTPEILWIGCADSRVPANQIIGMLPGSVFVHRNIANLVVHTDLNCLAVIQYAVDVLKVKHIIVCGHYDCGGITAVLDGTEHGLIDNWLRHIKDVYRYHREEIDQLKDSHARADRLCELNVIEQVSNVCNTTIVQNAWVRGQELSVHGWIYKVSNGILKELQSCVTNQEEARQLLS